MTKIPLNIIKNNIKLYQNFFKTLWNKIIVKNGAVQPFNEIIYIRLFEIATRFKLSVQFVKEMQDFVYQIGRRNQIIIKKRFFTVNLLKTFLVVFFV